jgi:hypothetical protein
MISGRQSEPADRRGSEVHVLKSVADRIGRPALFAVGACLLYLAALWPLLSHHKFDTSILIGAGREFVDPNRVPSPVALRAPWGYDGQFYYRLAIDPFTLAQDAYGVHIDNVPWRAQRILYPLIVHAAAFGRPEWVPAAMLIVNLAGLVAIAFFAARIARQLNLGWAFPIAVMLWPGLIITLARDLTEIVAAALLLAAIDSYLSRRMVLFTLFGAAATLTRETTLPFLLGVFLFEGWLVWKAREPLKTAIFCAVAVVPNIVWRVALAMLTEQPMLKTQLANADWPLLGYAKALVRAQNFSFFAMFVTISLLCLLVFLALVGVSIIRRPEANGVVVGWLLLALLMLCLAAGGGPLVEPIAYFRAFTECFMVGAIILAKGPLWRANVLLPCLAVLWYGAWQNVLGTAW